MRITHTFLVFVISLLLIGMVIAGSGSSIIKFGIDFKDTYKLPDWIKNGNKYMFGDADYSIQDGKLFLMLSGNATVNYGFDLYVPRTVLPLYEKNSDVYKVSYRTSFTFNKTGIEYIYNHFSNFSSDMNGNNEIPLTVSYLLVMSDEHSNSNIRNMYVDFNLYMNKTGIRLQCQNVVYNYNDSERNQFLSIGEEGVSYPIKYITSINLEIDVLKSGYEKTNLLINYIDTHGVSKVKSANVKYVYNKLYGDFHIHNHYLGDTKIAPYEVLEINFIYFYIYRHIEDNTSAGNNSGTGSSSNNSSVGGIIGGIPFWYIVSAIVIAVFFIIILVKKTHTKHH